MKDTRKRITFDQATTILYKKWKVALPLVVDEILTYTTASVGAAIQPVGSELRGICYSSEDIKTTQVACLYFDRMSDGWEESWGSIDGVWRERCHRWTRIIRTSWSAHVFYGSCVPPVLVARVLDGYWKSKQNLLSSTRDALSWRWIHQRWWFSNLQMATSIIDIWVPEDQYSVPWSEAHHTQILRWRDSWKHRPCTKITGQK